MKVLKIITLMSFLFIEGVQLHGTLNIVTLFIYLYQFISDIITFSHPSKIFWSGGLFGALVILTFVVVFSCKNYIDKYLLLFCFFALLITILVFSGVLYPENWHRISYGFLISFIIFMASSIILILKNFKNINK
mgnify:CR=1 FL=1